MGALPKRKISTHRQGRRRHGLRLLAHKKLAARLTQVSELARKKRYA